MTVKLLSSYVVGEIHNYYVLSLMQTSRYARVLHIKEWKDKKINANHRYA